MNGEIFHTKVVIAGAGASGLLAALTLTDRHVPVVVMERGVSAQISNFATCGGPSACETRLQKEAGVELSADQMFRHMSHWANHTVNEALLRNVVKCTGEAVDRMCDLGIPMLLIPDIYGVGMQARHMFLSKPGERVAPIVQQIEKNGGQFLWKTRMDELLFENGRAIGIAGTRNGQRVEVYADAVVICTGGFQGNKALLKRFFGSDRIVNLGSHFCQGDGLTLMEKSGAALDRNFALLGNEGGGTTTKGSRRNHNCAFALYGGLLLDQTGRRFINEKDIADFPLSIGGEAFVRNGRTYAIVDSACYDACCESGVYAWLGEPENWPTGRVLWLKVLDQAKAQFQEAVDQGWAWKADSLDALAAKTGIPSLPETVDQYNEYCANGLDPEFGKDPVFLRSISKAPFYCFEYEAACWGTNGGVRTNQFLQVEDREGGVIPGLYAAGVDCGSMYTAPYYNNDGASVGLAMGSGVYLGKLLIEMLAE